MYKIHLETGNEVDLNYHKGITGFICGDTFFESLYDFNSFLVLDTGMPLETMKEICKAFRAETEVINSEHLEIKYDSASHGVFLAKLMRYGQSDKSIEIIDLTLKIIKEKEIEPHIAFYLATLYLLKIKYFHKLRGNCRYGNSSLDYCWYSGQNEIINVHSDRFHKLPSFDDFMKVLKESSHYEDYDGQFGRYCWGIGKFNSLFEGGSLLYKNINSIDAHIEKNYIQVQERFGTNQILSAYSVERGTHKEYDKFMLRLRNKWFIYASRNILFNEL